MCPPSRGHRGGHGQHAHCPAPGDAERSADCPVHPVSGLPVAGERGGAGSAAAGRAGQVRGGQEAGRAHQQVVGHHDQGDSREPPELRQPPQVFRAAGGASGAAQHQRAAEVYTHSHRILHLVRETGAWHCIYPSTAGCLTVGWVDLYGCRKAQTP